MCYSLVYYDCESEIIVRIKNLSFYLIVLNLKEDNNMVILVGDNRLKMFENY